MKTGAARPTRTPRDHTALRPNFDAAHTAVIAPENTLPDLHSLLALAIDFHWLADANLRLTQLGGPLIEQGLLDPRPLIGTRLTDWHSNQWPRTAQSRPTDGALAEHSRFRDYECAIALASGDTHWFSLSGEPQRNAQGAFTGYSGVALDITRHLEQESRYRHMAYHDALTGLPNRRLLLDRLEQSVAQARRRGTRVALIMLDLDGFKLINDRHGHAAGDQALIHIGQHLASATRQSDTVARFGGDEFVVLLPQINRIADAQLVAAKIAEALATARPQLTASLGIALYPDHGWDASTLLRQADAAMYRAKKQGAAKFELATDAADLAPTDRPRWLG